MSTIEIRAPLCIAAGAIFPPICTAIVACRFYARYYQKTYYGLDDWLTIPTLVFLVGMCAALLLGVSREAVGYPTPPVPEGKTFLTTSSEKQTITRSVYWAIELMQIPALGGIKLSFVLFYRRIFDKGLDVFYKRVTLAVMALIGIWTGGYFFSFLFVCPGYASAYWGTLEMQQQHCINTAALHNSYGISDVILDFIVILMPIPMVLRLRMSASNKLGTIGIFSLGAFSVVASIFRMAAYLQSSAEEFRPTSDVDLLITSGIYWSVVESGVGLISTCLPTLYGTFRHTFKLSRLETPDAGSAFPVTRSHLAGNRQSSTPKALFPKVEEQRETSPDTDVDLEALPSREGVKSEVDSGFDEGDPDRIAPIEAKREDVA